MLLLSTSSLTWYGLHKTFILAKQAEYDGIDLSVDFDMYDSTNVDYIDSLIRLVDIPVISISAPERKLTKKQFDQILALADALWVSVVNVHPPHRLEKERDWFWEYLHTISTKYSGIVINVINAPPKTWLFLISEYGDARPETIKKITEHTALSIQNVDPTSGVDLMKTSILLWSTLWFIYLSDKENDEDGVFPGNGTMPLESLLIKLKEINYSGYFSLSVKPSELKAWEEDSVVIAQLKKCRVFLEKYFK